MSKNLVVKTGRDEKGLVQPAILNLFNEVTLGSLATTNPDASPHINTCYCAPDKNWTIFFYPARNLLMPKTLCAIRRRL